MSVLTHTPDALRGYRHVSKTHSGGQTATHIAMIKRFAALTLMLGGFTLTVTAAISLKVAIYLPQHLIH